MWLFASAPEYAENKAVMEKHGAEALYSTVKSLMYDFQTEDHDPQQDAVRWIIENAKLWIMKRWSESQLTNGKLLVWIVTENAHLVDLDQTKEEQVKQ
jgi:hypothetical protein